MKKLKQLEEKYQIVFPEIYKQMYADGMLNWGELGPTWYKTKYPSLKENPPILLFCNDYEPIYVEEVAQNIEDLTDEYLIPGLKFIPFAKNGGGDHYILQFDRQVGEEVPVTLWPHDEDYATILARNFQDFLFRMLVEPLTHIDEDSELITQNGNNTNALNILRTHTPYLTKQQIEVLNELYHRPIQIINTEYATGEKYSFKQIISIEEKKEIFEKIIGFEGLDQEFQYLD